MIRNYLLTAWRNLARNPGYSLSTIVGLSTGIAACLVITLYVQEEWSYDRFHKKSDRIYRVTRQIEGEGVERRQGVLEGPFAENLANDLPEVENAFRILQKNRTLLRNGETAVYESEAFYTDPGIFEVFDIAAVAGRAVRLLDEPGTIVLSESLAERLFGEEAAVGRDIYLDRESEPYRVTAVVRDLPENSHFSFGFLLPMPDQIYGLDRSQWAGFSAFYTYILLREDVDPETVEGKIPSWGGTYYDQEHFKSHSYTLQPLTDIHLYSQLEIELQPERIGEVSYLYIFSTVALLILVIAVINYVNLVTVRSADRSAEIGVRKVMGADAWNIRKQFMGESLVLVFIAVLLGMVFSELSLILLNDFLDLDLALNYLENALIPGLLLTIVVGTVLMSGFYPALLMSRISPSRSLKGGVLPVSGRNPVRTGMIAFQFGISTLLVIGSLVIWEQLHFVQNNRLGLETEQVVTLEIPSETPSASYRVLSERVAAVPGVEGVTGSMTLPSRTTSQIMAEVEGEPIQVTWNMVDRNYFGILGMEMVEGSGFEAYPPEQLRFKAVVNEAFLRTAGWETDEAVGNNIPGMLIPIQVVGVVRDFYFESLREQIAPQIIQYHHSSAIPGYLTARFTVSAMPQLLPELQHIWEEVYPAHPFSYFFLEDSFEQLYTSEIRLARVFSIFAGLAILISVMGLMSLVGYAVRKRQKEIGIRKVLGASTRQILLMLSGEFTRLVVVGFSVALPVAWYLANRWLSDFAYRVQPGMVPYLLAAGIVLMIALSTVLWQALGTARMNPTDSLRDE